MDKFIYTAMRAGSEVMLSEAIKANNIANSATPGFKADLQRMVSQQMSGGIFDTRVFASSEVPGFDFSPGSMTTDGNSLSVAISGEGFFAVQTADGKENYTRRGDFLVNHDGILINGSGYTVLGDGGAISIPPAKQIEIAADGTINVIPAGSNVDKTVSIGRLKLVKIPENNLSKSLEGLFVTKDGLPQFSDASVVVRNGVLESSNVNVINELTDMLALARNFEIVLKMLKTAETNDQASAQIMQLG